MALYAPLTAAIPSFPAKSPISNTVILRTPCAILHPSSSTTAFRPSTLSPKHVSTKTTLTNPLRATPPQKYVYPDPIPEFAIAESQKFRAELMKMLAKERGTFGNDLEKVVKVCTEVFSEYLHKEYGGPGTLLVEPFTDMMVELKERKLPGAPLAARASILWAQNYVDHDWEVWNLKPVK